MYRYSLVWIRNLYTDIDSIIKITCVCGGSDRLCHAPRLVWGSNPVMWRQAIGIEFIIGSSIVEWKSRAWIIFLCITSEFISIYKWDPASDFSNRAIQMEKSFMPHSRWCPRLFECVEIPNLLIKVFRSSLNTWKRSTGWEEFDFDFFVGIPGIAIGRRTSLLLPQICVKSILRQLSIVVRILACLSLIKVCVFLCLCYEAWRPLCYRPPICYREG